MTAKQQMLVRARALMGFAELVRSHGGDATTLLRHARLKPGILDQPDATLPFAAAGRLLEETARSLKLPDFGLRLSRHQDISVLGAVALIARHAATAGDALRGISRNFSYHTASARIRLLDDERTGRAKFFMNRIENCACHVGRPWSSPSPLRTASCGWSPRTPAKTGTWASCTARDCLERSTGSSSAATSGLPRRLTRSSFRRGYWRCRSMRAVRNCRRRPSATSTT